MKTYQFIEAVAALDKALTTAYGTGLVPEQLQVLFSIERHHVRERASMLDDMHARAGAGYPAIRLACEAASAALVPDFERPLCRILEDWCRWQGLPLMSADELGSELWHEQQRMEREHEDTTTIQTQRDWLEAYSTLWDSTI